MKIRTAEELYDRISQDLVWRKKELLVFNQVVNRVDISAAAQRSLLRGSVAMLYAHWEGFVKNCCHFYLCYIASKALSIADLSPELAALSIRNLLSEATTANRVHIHAEVVRRLRENQGGRASVPTDRDAIRTRSNLSSEVLREVMQSVGCSVEPYERYQDIIDTQLVKSRNEVAHGEDSNIRSNEWRVLYHEIVVIMDAIAADITNAAAVQSYRAKSSASSMARQ